MTREQRISRLIEDVYEVATDPSQWPCFLVSMQDFFKAENIVMGLINQSEHRNSLSLDYAVDFDPEFKESYDNYYCHKNVQARRAIQQGAMKKGNVLNTEDFFSIEEWMRTEIFNDWGRPQNVFLGYAPVLAMDERTFGLLSIARSPQTGRMSKDELRALRRLTPHLTRAIDLYLRVGLVENLRVALLDASNRFGYGALFINEKGAVITCNDAAKRILDQNDGLFVDRNRRLVSWKREETVTIQRRIAEAMGKQGSNASDLLCTDLGAFALSRPSGKRCFSLLITPIRLDHNHGRNDHAQAVVFIDDPEASPLLPTKRLMDLYGLSEAEAMVVTALCQGKSLSDIADERQTSKNTVKSLLQRAYQKTGTTRQGQIVSLVMNNVVLRIDKIKTRR